MTNTKKPGQAAAASAQKAKAKVERELERAEARVEAREEIAGEASFDPWLRGSQVATVGLFIIAVLWAAYVAQPIVVPVLLAWVIATIVLPLVKLMQEYKVPRAVASILVTIGLVTLIIGLLALLSTPMTYWLGRATELGVLLKQKLHTMTQPLALLTEVRKALNLITLGEQPAIKVEESSATVVTTIFAVLTPAVSQFILFIGALVFYLVYRQRIRSALVYFLRNRERRLNTLRTLNDVDENMTVYFGTFTIVNFCLGVVTVGLTWLVGLPNPLLWGVLAAVMNFVPYLGPAIVIGTLAVVGLLTFPTLGEALVAPAVYLGMATIEGQFITPTLMGRRLELNPFAVFLAIAFCTWLWGPVGAFLAVPLLMALWTALGHAFAEEKPDLPD